MNILAIIFPSLLILLAGLLLFGGLILKERAQKKKTKEKNELYKKAGKIQIIEKFDEDGNNYFIVEQTFILYGHLDSRIYLFTREKTDNFGFYGEPIFDKIPIRFDTPEEAQEKSNERAEELKRKKKAKDYRKVVGEFEV